MDTVDGTSTTTKIESVEWIEATRFLIHWFPQIDAERLAYGGVLSGNGYFAPATLLIPM